MNQRSAVASCARSLLLLGSLLATFLMVSCTPGDREQSHEALGRVRQALTTEQQRVLGFESPNADWTASAGTQGASSNASQGTTALSIQTSVWTEISSVALSGVGSFSTVSYDIELPESAPWGETRLILRAPSAGIYWLDLGGMSFVGAPAGAYNTVSVTVPGELVDDLAAATDLSFTIAINGPALSGPYLIDNLQLNDSTAAAISVSLTVPDRTPLGGIQLWASNRLELTDRVTGAESVVSLDDATIGNASHVDTLLAVGPLYVGHDSTVETAATTSFSGPGTVNELITIDDPPPPLRTVSWEAVLPTESSGTVTLSPGVSGDASAGRYDSITVFTDATLHMAPGTYFVNDLVVEPDGVLALSPEGVTIIYVLNLLNYKGRVETTTPGRFAVVYMGSADTVLERSLGAALVAPNAKVRLATPPTDPPIQSGAFFAKELLVSPDVVLQFIPPNVLAPQVTDDSVSCQQELGSSSSGDEARLDGLVLCSGFEDLCMAEMTAKAGQDQWAASVRLIAKAFSPARYLGVSRDRTRKLRKARAPGGDACAVVAADDDGDLVPNSIDECPDTPPLTPTDDVGCTEALPDAPDPDQVSGILDTTGIAIAPSCLATPAPSVPNTPTLFSGSFSAINEMGEIALAHVVNTDFRHDREEHGECVSFYLLDFERRAIDETDPNGRPLGNLLRFAPSLDHYHVGSAGQVSLRFRVNEGIAPPAQDGSVIGFFDRPGFYRFRIMAIDLSGNRSHWSLWSDWYLRTEGFIDL